MTPVTEKRWRLRQAHGEQIALLQRELGLSPLVARVLVNRGIQGVDEGRRFLSSTLADIRDPVGMKGITEGVQRLLTAHSRQEQLCIYGDYDVDGVTAVALLVHALRRFGFLVTYHIPRRLEEGYGLNAESLREIAARGATLVVTVDCGITAQAEAQVARQLGMDLIITDHHTPGAELPEAFAVINPLQPGCAYPFKSLAGVGIAFALLIALRSRFRQEGLFGEGQEPNLRQYLDLVALGTIADVVPLVEENRIFVRHGLLELTAARRVGVAALKEVAAVKGEVSCGQVGFRLAPRLNAAGRLHDATLGVELLLTEDPEHARNLARQLDESNRERQSVEQEILAQAVAQVEGNEAFRHRRSIVLAAEGWHPGVIGIVASRLVELFHRPTVLIALANGTGRGSARSIPHFHLYDALAACGEYLAKFGGHRQAAGLSLDQGILTQFIHRFEEVAAGLLTDDQLQPELAIDAELKAEEVTERLLTDISTLAPFGMGNPEPIFTITAMQVTNRRVVGGGHLKLSLRSGGRQFDAIGFGMGSRLPTSDRVDLAFSLSENEWQGERSLQLRLRDIRDAVS